MGVQDAFFVSDLLEFEAQWYFVVGSSWGIVVLNVERVRVDLVLSVDVVHSLSAFAIVEEVGSEFAHLHAAPCTVRNYIFERTRHWTTAEGLVDQAFGGETSKGPTWCSNRRKNETLTNQFISKHKQVHNKNINDNRQNQFPPVHLAGNWRLLLTSATTLSIYWGNLPSPSLATWVAIAVGWHDLFSSRRATLGQAPLVRF